MHLLCSSDRFRRAWSNENSVRRDRSTPRSSGSPVNMKKSQHFVDADHLAFVSSRGEVMKATHRKISTFDFVNSSSVEHDIHPATLITEYHIPIVPLLIRRPDLSTINSTFPQEIAFPFLSFSNLYINQFLFDRCPYRYGNSRQIELVQMRTKSRMLEARENDVDSNERLFERPPSFCGPKETSRVYKHAIEYD